MASTTEIAVNQLTRLIGLPDAPVIVDLRTAAELETDPRTIPGAVQRSPATVPTWSQEFAGRHVVAYCQAGGTTSQGAAASLRHEGIQADTLIGGFDAWREGGGLLVSPARLSGHDERGRTLWVTRARPKIDRIACPWLIRRFVDPQAVFLFVVASEVQAVAKQFGAAPFDIEGAFWSHRGDHCTFDVMLIEFGLKSDALDRLAIIVRAADTNRLDLAPQAPGLLAASLGLSRMYRNDLDMLEAGLLLYDAMYRWCRDAGEETHDWPTPGKG